MNLSDLVMLSVNPSWGGLPSHSMEPSFLHSCFTTKKVRLVSRQPNAAGSVRFVVFWVKYASGWSPIGPQGSVGLLLLMG